MAKDYENSLHHYSGSESPFPNKTMRRLTIPLVFTHPYCFGTAE